eukprot:scaffold164303_cov32-Tisochrysis_lutea.AAC.2
MRTLGTGAGASSIGLVARNDLSLCTSAQPLVPLYLWGGKKPCRLGGGGDAASLRLPPGRSTITALAIRACARARVVALGRRPHGAAPWRGLRKHER